MTNPWLKRWNDRYRQQEYAYGTLPNEFLKKQLGKLTLGNILFPAEGEGRNAVYAAREGWHVHAFDISEEGRKKALQLAQKNNVSIDYQVGVLPDLQYKEEQFDAIALIYAHFPPALKAEYHKILDLYLKKGGTIIFEAFGKNHLKYRTENEKVGGPKDLDALFSTDELRSYFTNYKIISLVEEEVELREGLYHNGKGSVVRFVGQKQ